MRQGRNASETARNQRGDELAGVSGRATERGLRVRDIDGILSERMAEVAKTVLGDMTARKGLVTLGADVINSDAVANTIADITGLSFPVVAGEVCFFRALILYTAAATTTGARFSVTGPAAPTRLAYSSRHPLTATTETLNTGLNAYDLPAAAGASSASTSGNVAVVEGFIVASANGIVTLRFASEVAGSAIVAKKGSFVEWSRSP